MKYYSTNRRTPEVSLREAVVASMAPDNGLYMPERIERLPDAFFDGIARLDLHRIACRVADAFFGEEIEPETLRRIVRDTFCFDIPVVRVDDGIWALELFHGPTMAFKDVGARFMARILSHFIEGRDDEHPVTVLVATSGDTGGAVANGFLGVEGIDVVVLYPKGRVSDIQEKQFTTLGRNVTALEIEGTFDDCQRLVKSAFADTELKRRMRLTSANSINVARFLPQTFYFFHAYAQLRAQGVTSPIVVSVPSGNFGNLTAGLFARRMGLPVDRFIAANNANDTFYEYLRTGSYRPRPSVPTLANAMDVGDPNNFARILDLYGRSLDALRAALAGKLSCLTGNSGVGKSSLLNCVSPGLQLPVGEVSEKLGRGRHTTRHVELFPLADGTCVIDTPGFSSFDTEQMELILKENLQYAFPDFAPYLGRCRYHDCSHLSEPGCAVLEALAAGELEPTRHTSYARLYEAAKEIRLWEHKQP